MIIRNFIRPGKPLLMAVLCSLLLIGLNHCGQKGGLTRPEQAATATR